MAAYEHSQPDALSRILDDKGRDDAPESRPSSTTELASAVEHALNTPTTTPSPPPSAPEARPYAEEAEDAETMKHEAHDEDDEHEVPPEIAIPVSSSRLHLGFVTVTRPRSRQRLAFSKLRERRRLYLRFRIPPR